MVGITGVINKAKTTSYNEGLRRYMLGVYNYTSIELLISSIVAFVTAKTGLVYALVGSPLGWIVAFAPIILSVFMSVKLTKSNLSTIKIIYFLFAVLYGLSFSTLFLMFSGIDITKTFLITSCMFGGMSIYGYTTKKDLTSSGSYLIMAVWGLLIASIINIFTKNSGLSFAISLISVVVFTILIAYDTQNIKKTYYAVCQDKDLATRFGIFGALQLYLDFIAIFIHLLQLLGNVNGKRN